MYDNQMMLDLSYFGEGELKEFGEERCGIITPISKAWISDLSVDLTSTAIQVYGGMGYVEETGIAQYFRDARIAPIYAGTNGIQALDLMFRKITFDEGKPTYKLIDEMYKVSKELKNEDDLSDLGQILKKHIDELKEATELMLSLFNNGELSEASGASTPYLKIFGQVLGGYYMGRAALIANKKTDENNEEFYSDKLILSKFYIEQLLPLTTGYLASIKSGSKDLFKIKSSNI